MEAVLADRQFYANIKGLGKQKARELFRSYYGREPEVVIEMNGMVIAGPVTKSEVRLGVDKGE